jgi:hypothetical protein
VICQVCGKEFPQITSTHLKMHCMTPDDYKNTYPDAVMIGADVVNVIRAKLTGIQKSEEHKANISASRSGVVPKNHPRFIVGAYKHSDEAKQKMSDAHNGILHTDESKAKIGDAHRGKIQPPDAVERQKQWMIDYHKDNDGFFKGKTHTEENRKTIGENTRRHMNSMTPEQKAAYAETMSKAMTGLKRTPE